MRRIAVCSLALAGIACTGDVPTRPSEGKSSAPTESDPARTQTMMLACSADRVALKVTCDVPSGVSPKGDVRADITYGSQNVFVKLVSSAVAYNSGTGQFTFNVTVQNLLQQPIGTTDGTTLDPNGVRIFFVSGPTKTAGTGTVAVIPDGFATFTAAGQPYYQYNQVLANSVTSSVKGWTLVMPPTVTSFDFQLLVSAPVQYPSGYIEINGHLPGFSLGNLHPGSTVALTGIPRNALGQQVAGTVTWGATDANMASVDGGGTVTGVRYGTTSITASDGTRNGSIFFNVTGTQRNWTGATSTTWNVGTNWAGGYTPALVDTANIPLVGNLPVLTTSEAIGALEIADGATTNLGAFNITLTKYAGTGQGSGGVTGTTGKLLMTGTGTIGGRFSLVEVTGNYTADANVRVVAPITVKSGTFLTPGFLTFIAGQ